MKWTPWRYNGCPPVGLYVQVHCVHETTKTYRIFEGEIAGYDGDAGWFVGERPDYSSPWRAFRWRARTEPSLDEFLETLVGEKTDG
jgi:hypothetical protein